MSYLPIWLLVMTSWTTLWLDHDNQFIAKLMIDFVCFFGVLAVHVSFGFESLDLYLKSVFKDHDKEPPQDRDGIGHVFPRQPNSSLDEHHFDLWHGEAQRQETGISNSVKLTNCQTFPFCLDFSELFIREEDQVLDEVDISYDICVIQFNLLA